MSRPKLPAQVYKVILGSNVINNCRNIVRWNGKEQIFRFRDGKDMKLLVDCAVKDSDNHTIIQIASNKIVHIDNSIVSYEYLENGIIVKDKISAATYLEFLRLGEREVKINGIFHVNGVKIEATDEGLDINGLKFGNCVFDNCGGLIDLGFSGINRPKSK